MGVVSSYDSHCRPTGGTWKHRAVSRHQPWASAHQHALWAVAPAWTHRKLPSTEGGPISPSTAKFPLAPSNGTARLLPRHTSHVRWKGQPRSLRFSALFFSLSMCVYASVRQPYLYLNPILSSYRRATRPHRPSPQIHHPGLVIFSKRVSGFLVAATAQEQQPLTPAPSPGPSTKLRPLTSAASHYTVRP